MLHRLEIKNGFKHPNTVIDFKNGLTAITGPNESGKSMIFEMIAYALFGTIALRGAADDYKKMKVTLDFDVLGKKYQISRQGSKTLLMLDGRELTTGTKTTNPKIVEILGYDYKVFMIANCANQDELTKLGTMKPTERKQMVDNVIGLNIIDKLSAAVQTKAAELNIQVETLRINLVQPVAPIKPEHYRPIADLRTMSDELSVSEKRYAFLHIWLQTILQQPIAPVDPQLPPLKQLMEEFNALNLRYQQFTNLQAKVNGYVTPTLTKEQIMAARKAWNEIEQRIEITKQLNQLVDKPVYTKDQLDAFGVQGTAAFNWSQKQKLLEAGENHCPKCKHHWPIAAEELNKFKDVVETPYPAYTPTPQDYSLIQLYDQQTGVRTALEAKLAALPTWPNPGYTLSQLDAQERALNDFDSVAAARKEMLELQADLSKPQYGYAAAIEERQAYDQAVSAYSNAVESYNRWVVEYLNNKKEYEALAHVPNQMVALRTLMEHVSLYDFAYQQYEQALTRYNTAIADIQEKSILFNQYEKTKVALKEARSTVKKYLVPSLNRVASALLAQMTGGARSNIEVTEDFEIFVDGQPLNTLSGSGKAVANLAIRIALGQVLIAKKFPIFMADEIDGSMDADRAEFTSECLQRLTKHVKQLFLISHKRPDADHYIELGR